MVESAQIFSCKTFGAASIILPDIADARLEKVKRLRTRHVIYRGKAGAKESITKLTGDFGVDIVFKTAGSPVTDAQTLFSICHRGTIVLTGIFAQRKMHDRFA